MIQILESRPIRVDSILNQFVRIVLHKFRSSANVRFYHGLFSCIKANYVPLKAPCFQRLFFFLVFLDLSFVLAQPLHHYGMAEFSD